MNNITNNNSNNYMNNVGNNITKKNSNKYDQEKIFKNLYNVQECNINSGKGIQQKNKTNN